MHWEHQTGSMPSSAFVIAEPRGLQKMPPTKNVPVVSSSQKESSCGSANTLAAPLFNDPQAPQPQSDGTLKGTSSCRRGDEEESVISSGVKTNGPTPRPIPPNVI